MNVKNTVNDYGSIAKWLHWGSAMVFFGAYISVYYRHWFTEDKTPENWTALQLHLSFGVTLGVLVILRIIWRMNNRTPDPEPGTKLANLAAHVGHYALYAVLIIMPVTGYLGAKVDTEFFFIFDIARFESTQLFQSFIRQELGISYEKFEAPLDFIHKQVLGQWLAWMLIVGHVLAALYHHFIKQDRTLKKMTTNK
ncbi:cytochrome b [Cognaticolwellia beringensis]|uniref:Cytochrome b n=1 Tax=Cognaticolwellia beringensis TaxID=1967665 RepID=A0A222GCK9_9GAMM|nr:cytochrome b [Cognaticolwellia beringensis]ASP49442.1 cytochrome b [Cognaticolwellia beringensis]